LTFTARGLPTGNIIPFITGNVSTKLAARTGEKFEIYLNLPVCT